MPDVPRDPRQLARDILSGKIKIEDLARERQMRGGGVPMPRPPVPDKVPLPRMPPPRPPVQSQMPRPMQRVPVPPRQQQRTVPQQRPIPQQRQVPARVPPRQVPRPGPPVTLPPRAQRPVQPPPPPPAAGAPAVPYGSTEAEAAARPVKRPVTIKALVKSRRAMRQGILLAEVLGKPVALRDDP